MAMPNSPVLALRLPLQRVRMRKLVGVRLRALLSRSMRWRRKRWSVCYKNSAVIWVTRFLYMLGSVDVVCYQSSTQLVS